VLGGSLLAAVNKKAPAEVRSANRNSTPPTAKAFLPGADKRLVFELDSALRETVELGGSDLHAKVGSPPMTRVNGELAPSRATSR